MLAEHETITGWVEQRQEVSPELKFAFLRLTCAIIEQAARDARKATPAGADARAWLLSDDCAELCAVINLDFSAVRAWVKDGCKNQDNKTAGG